MQQVRIVITEYLNKVHIPSVGVTDIAEILLIAFLIYHMLNWIKNTRAWSLLRGLVAIFIFILTAALFNMSTVLWIVRNVAGIFVMGLVVILQPELRKGMEELGQKNFLRNIFHIDTENNDVEDMGRITSEIVRACVEMAKVKTGALIVLQKETPLQEYAKTGIEIDALVSSQLLINIFEKNTPLHDGAVIISGNRVVAATCYLPLSESSIDKGLGTRHRAGLGIAETTDSYTIIVSEETGRISGAYKGKLTSDMNPGDLKSRLTELFQTTTPYVSRRSLLFQWIGRDGRNE